MKPTFFPMALPVTDKISKPRTLSNFKTLLLGLALLGTAHCGLAQGGTVIAWGDNRFGQTNVPPGLSNVVAIASGEWHNIALKADGTLVGWGVNNVGQRDIPADVTNVVAIATGGYHNLAIKADGTVRAWGANEYGQSNVPAGLNNVVAVSGGWVHSLALRANGTVVAWGRNNEGQASVPFDLNNVVAIASGEYHNLALKADGTVVGWGWNGFGQANIPPELSNNVVAIAANGLHSLALKKDGTVTAWGWNQYGQVTVPAGLINVAALAGGAEHSLALKSDGTVIGWGANDGWAENDPNCANISYQCPRKYTGQIDVPAWLNNVVSIKAGVFHSVALRANGPTPPPPSRFTLTKNVSPAGSGSINVAPASGDGKYDANAVVTLTAVAEPNKIFTGWSGAASGTNNPIQITMNGNKTVTANFAPASTTGTVTLTVNVNPSSGGVVYVTPYSASGSYPVGTVVTLTAQTEGTNVFSAWTGNASGISNQISVVMNNDKTVTALFNNPGKFVFQNANGRLAQWFLQGTNRLASINLNDGVPVASNWQLAGVGDLDANGSKDFLFRGANGRLMAWFMDGNVRTRSAMWRSGAILPAAWRIGGMADFNNDNKADVLLQNTSSGALTVWLMNGMSNTSSVKLADKIGVGWRAAATADFDNNSTTDIVFQAPDGRVAIWLMNGYTREISVLPRKAVTAGKGFVVVGATDIDEDGNTDIVFQRADGTIKVWFMRGASFNREETLPTKMGGGWKLRGVK